MTRPAFHLRGIPVYVPMSAAIGFGLISWLALPAAEKLVGTGWLSIFVALAHGFMLYVAIFIHEVGHALTARRLGYQAQEIVVHLLGGHTAFKKAFSKPSHLGFVGFMGPAANLAMGVAAFALSRGITQPIVSSMFAWLVWSTFAMAVLNLLPGTPLDGGSVLQAIVWAITKSEIKGQRVAAYGGFLVAGLWASTPFIMNSVFGWQVNSFDVFFSVFIAYWLAAGAASSLRASRNPNPVPDGNVMSPIRPYIRKAVAVQGDATCETAVIEAQDAGAGAILIVQDKQVIGIVREAALSAIPFEMRSSTPISTAARRITESDKISVDATLEDLQREFASAHSQEWLVLDSQGAIVGVLQKSDLSLTGAGDVGI